MITGFTTCIKMSIAGIVFPSRCFSGRQRYWYSGGMRAGAVSSEYPVLSAILGRDKGEQRERVPIKLLQCNEEQCQFEYRRNGEIEWASNSSQMVDLPWSKPPETVLLIKKPNSIDASQAFQQVANFLHIQKNMTILAEPAVKDEFPHLQFLQSISTASERDQVAAATKQSEVSVPWTATPASGEPISIDDGEEREGELGARQESSLQQTQATSNRSATAIWDGRNAGKAGGNVDVNAFDNGRAMEREKRENMRAQLQRADFVVCLGGDGTILWTSGMFKGPCPPVVSFAMGSLGFLTPFDYSEYKQVLEAVIAGKPKMCVRTRLECKVINDLSQLESTHMVLNEVTVDRGESPFLTNITCLCNDKFVTTAQGDGIIVATPTGSTAYSLAAGGSMVHPDVPGILLTPICTQSLSFRPIIFPDSVTLRLEVPNDCPDTACASFDGKETTALKKGWSVVISNSKWPIPILTRAGDDHDWFQGVMECLHWNNRKAQGSFDRAHSGQEEPKQVMGKDLPSMGE